MKKKIYYTDKEIVLVDKALKVVEVLAEHGCDGPTNHKDDCQFCLIFQIAHAGRSPSCQSSHPEWPKKIHELYRDFSA